MTAPLASRVSQGQILHLPAMVSHARRGSLKHAFRYGVDYVLLSPEHAVGGWTLGRNRFGLFAVHDRDHGGPRHAGTGAAWAWEQLESQGVHRTSDMVLGLLTQPRFLGYWFNPVSFWLLWKGDDLCAVIAEVNNTFGQRHSYFCAHPDFHPITRGDQISATKIFHVSPFQDVSGHYDFRFDFADQRVAISIRHSDGAEGLAAAMSGNFHAATPLRLIAAALRRPGGALRTIALIYWQALRLKLKGAAYRTLPPSPEQEISR